MAEQRNAEPSTHAPEVPQALTQGEIDLRVFDLYDEYCHGRIDRREFLQQAAAVTVGGLAMAQALLPRYAYGMNLSRSWALQSLIICGHGRSRACHPMSMASCAIIPPVHSGWTAAAGVWSPCSVMCTPISRARSSAHGLVMAPTQ